MQRLRERLAQHRASRRRLEAVLEGLSAELRRRLGAAPGHLQWIKASVGASVKLIPVEQLVCRRPTRNTRWWWGGWRALIRKTIREPADELDPSRFVQTHRSVIVNPAPGCCR